MVWKGDTDGCRDAGVALGVPVALFLLFEMWFLVPLPKGPLERMLGLLERQKSASPAAPLAERRTSTRG